MVTQPFVLNLQKVFQHGSATDAAKSAQCSTSSAGVRSATDNLATGDHHLFTESDHSELTAAKSSDTDAAGHPMTPAVPGSTTAVGVSIPEVQLLQPQLSSQALLESLVGSAVYTSIAPHASTQPVPLLTDPSISAHASTQPWLPLADPSTAAGAEGSMQASTKQSKQRSASQHHLSRNSTSPRAAGGGPDSLVSMLSPVSELLSLYEATPDSLQSANSSSLENCSAEGKILGYADVMQLTASPFANALPPEGIIAADLAATAASQTAADTLCTESSVNKWQGSVACVPQAAEPKKPSGADPKDASCNALTGEPEDAAFEAGMRVDTGAQTMHEATAAVTAPPSVHMSGSCMEVQQELDNAASSESGWVDIELFPSSSGMLQGRDDAAIALTDSTNSSQWGSATPCAAEAGSGMKGYDSNTASDRPASQSNKAVSLGVQAQQTAPVGSYASTSASTYLSLAQPAFWRREPADSSTTAAAQEPSSSADAPILSKVSQHLQQLTDAARPSVAEATAAAAAKAAELKATASAMTADFSAQAAERAAQLRSKLGVRLSSRQPSAAIESRQGHVGTGAVSTRLSTLQHTAGKHLAAAGAWSGAKHACSPVPNEELDSIQAQHGSVTLLADHQDPDKGMRKGKDGGHITRPLPRQIVECHVTSTTADQIEAVQTSAQAGLSAKYALADVLGFYAASVDRVEATASTVASWWSRKKPKQSL